MTTSGLNIKNYNKMINPNNLEDLAEVLSEVLDTLVSPEFLKLVPETDRGTLTSLIYKWETTKDSDTFVEQIKTILDKSKKKDLKGKEVDKQEFIK